MRKGDKITLMISKERLYDLYKGYSKDFYSNSRCQDIDSFYRSLEKVGIGPHAKRRMIGGSTGVRRTRIDIDFENFKNTMIELYKGIHIETWSHEENYAGFLKKMEDFKSEYSFDDT